MIELVLSVCLMADPGKCKDVHLTYVDGEITPFTCMMYGQTEAAKWGEGNPSWAVKGWKCGVAKQVAKI